MERQITISIEEYNKLIDMHTKREELPEKIEVKKFTSKWWKWLKRASYSLFHYNKNVEQQKLIKRCINEMSSVLLDIANPNERRKERNQNNLQKNKKDEKKQKLLLLFS